MGPFELGMEHDAVLARLVEANIEIEADDDDPRWMFLPEIETSLTFGDDEPPCLVQIVVEDERIRLGTLPVLGQRVHQIVELLQVPESKMPWSMGGDPCSACRGATGSSRQLPPTRNCSIPELSGSPRS